MAALLLAACVGSGTAPEEDPFRSGLWPFYTADRRAWAGVREGRALGPLLHWEQSGGRRLFEARPLYSSLQDEKVRRWDVLFPLAARRERPDGQKQRSLLLLARSRVQPGGATETFLGVAFGGRTASGQRFGGLFPLLGSFREQLGFDRIDFLLWPLFARGRRGAYTETQILWPFFAYGSGPGRGLLRIWPLFGVEWRKGVFERRFYLWPLIHRSHEKLDSRQPVHTLLILPFYGRRDAGPLASRFYLFPLYLHQWNRDKPEVQRLGLLWPLYERERRADGTEWLALRPFFVRTRGEHQESFSILFGAFGRGRRHSEELEERIWRVLWVGRISSRLQRGVRTRHRDLWPLYRSLHVVNADGTEHGFQRVPYLIPMRGLEPDGWDRHYNKLFEVYGARWQGEETRSSLLFGFLETRRAPGLRWQSWGGLLHLRRQDIH